MEGLEPKAMASPGAKRPKVPTASLRHTAGRALKSSRQVLIGEAQVLLRVEGIATQACVLVRLGKSARRSAQAGLVLVRPVQQDDGVVQIGRHRRRVVHKHVHPHGRGADHLPRAHAVHIIEMALPGGARLCARPTGADGGLRAVLRLGEPGLP